MIPAMAYTPPTRLKRAGRDIGIPETLYVPGFLDPLRADELLQEVDAAGELATRTFHDVRAGADRAPPDGLVWRAGARGYRYSGVDRLAEPWLPSVRRLAEQVAAAVGWRFNYVLVNRYRTGRDALGWHADDESDLGDTPVLAAVSVGAERVFRCRPRRGGQSEGKVLGHGSLLLMWGDSQIHYKHCVPPTRRAVGERLSFTFRLTRSP